MHQEESLLTGNASTQADIGLILKALDFAAQKHRDQRRKDPAASPYINHPITLSNLLWNMAQIDDAIVIAGALLHDTVEDTDTTFEELTQVFGQEIQALVREVTDDKTLPKPVRKQLQIDHAPHLSDRAKLVKLADKIANLQDLVTAPPHNWSTQRQQEYFLWAKAVIDPIRGTHAGLEQHFDEVFQTGMAQFSKPG